MNGQAIPADQFVEDKRSGGAIPANQFVEDPPSEDIPDNSAMKKYVGDNLKTHFEGQKGAKTPDTIPGAEAPVAPSLEIKRDQEGKVKTADGFIDAVEAGLQMSVLGLSTRGGTPNVVLPEHAPMYMNIGYQLGQIVPDLPVMAAGEIAGTAATANPIAGAGAAFALPTALRKIMMDHYEKGDIKTAEEFWTRLSSTMIDSAKSFVVGAATMGVGGKVAGAVGQTAAPAVVKTAAQLSSEIATMTTVGKALEGEMPSARDFTEAAIMVGGFHGVAKVNSKLKEIYYRTGMKPSEIALQAENEPTIKQDLLSENKDVPDVYKNAQDPTTVPKSVELPINPESEFGSDTVTIEEPPKAETPKKEAVTEAEKARDTIKSKIYKEGDVGFIESAGEKVSDFNKNFYTNFVDKFNPIQKAVDEMAGGKEVLPSKDAYVLSRMANDHKAKTLAFLTKGTVDFNKLEYTGESLKTRIESAVKNKELGDLDAYLIARRARVLEAKNIKSGFDKEAVETLYQADKGKFEEMAAKVTDFSNQTLKYARDAGLVSQEGYRKILDSELYYVPFKRVIEGTDKVIGSPSKGAPVRRIKGVKSEDILTQSPLQSIAENTANLVELAEKNRAITALIKLAESTPDQTLIKEVPQKMVPVKVHTNIKGEEFPSLFDEKGIDQAQAESVMGFMKVDKNLKTNEFEVWVDGKRKVYETTEELATSIKALDGDAPSTNILFKMAKIPATALRVSLGLTPDFILRNAGRDFITSAVFSENKNIFSHAAENLIALKELMNKDTSEAYKQFLLSGGASGAFLDLSTHYLDKNIFKLTKETGMTDRAYNALTSPIHFLKASSEMLEQAPRLAAFMRETKGDYSTEKKLAGGFDAREITVDFQRMGAKTAALNAIDAFFNVTIQGADRTVRAVKEDPKGTGLRTGLLVTLPSLLLWAANKDDPRYKDLPGWQKYLFWIMPTDKWELAGPNDNVDGIDPYLKKVDSGGKVYVNKGTIYRGPKPQELGMIAGSGVEAALTVWHDKDPKAAGEFASSLLQAFMPSLIPNIATPFVESFSNRSLFTGNPIVSAQAEKNLPEFRYSDYTSETAKKLSHLVTYVPGGDDITPSPAMIDNWIMAWTGNLGKDVVQGLDYLGKKAGIFPDGKPETGLADMPIIKAFIVRHPSSGTAPIKQVFEEARHYSEIFESVKFLQKNEQISRAEEVLAKIPDLHYAQVMVGTAKAMGQISSAIHSIRASSKFTPVEKTQMIESFYYQQNEMAKRGLKEKGESK